MQPVKLPQLDVLRGMCALLVVFYHVLFQHPGHGLGVFRNASLFVDFFFVLSGFIMFHTYGNMASGHDFRRFLGLRLFRTYPLHVVMIVVFLAYETLQYALVTLYDFPTSTPPFSDNNAGTLLLNLLLLNGVGITDLTFNTPSWSISTEFWAYVVFGLSMLSLSQLRARLLLFAAIGIAALGYLAVQPDPSMTMHWERFLPRCLFGFFMGVVLRGAMSVPREAPETRPWHDAVQLASMALSVALVSYADEGRKWIELLAPFAFTAVIASFVAWPGTRIVRALINAPLLWLGKVSYSIYMVHQFVLLMIEAAMKIVLHAPVDDELILVGNAVGGSALILSLALILGIAAFTYHFVEEPARRLGRAWLDGAKPSPREARREPTEPRREPTEPRREPSTIS
jgi:peptidoglycan/LPS O-acetylase OafA/YrhL